MSFQENIPVHTPRPPNAFFCFRSWFVRKQKEAAHTAPGSKGSYMRDVSRQAAQRWNSMSDEEKRPYFDMALRMRDEHKVAYPDYKFAPAKRGSKSLVQPAGSSHRPARTTKGHRGPESAPSFTSGSFDGGSPSRLTPTPSSPSTPPLDRLYRARDSSYISSGLGKGPNEVCESHASFWNALTVMQ
ncbi:high mobility group box domain-containing protein [Mycena olivaceomarginata]|nr:high mobility group box domain-containing protein [Mycena olivaceomarginata]